MKPVKIAFLFLVIVLNFSSCGTMRVRNTHDRILRAELGKYSDFLDLKRTEIHFFGTGYYFWTSAMPALYLFLYLKPEHNNTETLINIRDGLIDFFHNNWGEARIWYNYLPFHITVKFTLGETKTFYSLGYLGNYFALNKYTWVEMWYSELFFEQPIRSSVYADLEEFGKPIIGRTIHNEELVTLLRKYAGGIDVKPFDVFHSGTDFIKIWLIIPNNPNRETVLVIRDELIYFFENNQQELIQEYGQVKSIEITIYRMYDAIYRENIFKKSRIIRRPINFYTMIYKNNEWEERWYWGYINKE